MARILVVVGGSLGGLFAANRLWRDGHDVQVLEKVRGSMSGRGAGIVSHDALTSALAHAGLPDAEALGVQVSGRVLLDPDGRTLSRLDMPQLLTSWSRLYDLLRRAFPAERYHQGVAVAGVQQQDGGVMVQAQAEGGKQTWSAELLVASDGIRSGVRQQLLPAVQPCYAGYVAWRGVCDEMLLSIHTMQTLFPYFGFCVPDGEQIIGYPVAGADNPTAPGHRAYNFVWYRPAPGSDALRALMTDADGQHRPLGIAPNKVSWHHLAHMREDACERLAPQWAEVVQKAAQPFLQAIHDLACDRLAHGRVALMGDSAFVARPGVGMGVTKAAQDAQAPCAALRAHGATPAALRAYEAEALPRGRYAVSRAPGWARRRKGWSRPARWTARSRLSPKRPSTWAVMRTGPHSQRHQLRPPPPPQAPLTDRPPGPPPTTPWAT